MSSLQESPDTLSSPKDSIKLEKFINSIDSNLTVNDSPSLKLSSSLPLSHSLSTPQNKSHLVQGLIDIAADMIVHLWPNTLPLTNQTQLFTLHHFISEMVRRSLTSFSTFELALLLLARLKHHLPSILEQQRYPKTSQFIKNRSISPQISSLSLYSPDITLQPSPVESPIPSPPNIPISHPLLCGRRSFLSSLILAWKFLQDKTYTNSAWSRICGLPVSEINDNEKCVLGSLGWNLAVDSQVFSAWSQALEKLAKIRVHRIVSNNQPNHKVALDEVANLIDSAVNYETYILEQQRIRNVLIHAGLYSNGVLNGSSDFVPMTSLPHGVIISSQPKGSLDTVKLSSMLQQLKTVVDVKDSGKIMTVVSSLQSTLQPPRHHTRRNSSALKIIAEIQQKQGGAGGPIRRKRARSSSPRIKKSLQ